MTCRSRALARALAFAWLACVTSAPSLARADDDPRKKAAESTFNEGVRLHAQGKDEEALVKLKKAYEMYPSPNTLGGIARAEQALGRNLEALRHYREALRNPLMHPENAEHAKGAIAELEKNLARIVVKGPTGLVLVIEGAEVVLPLAEPVDVRAQTFELEGTLVGTKYAARTTAPIGRVTEIVMVAQGAPPAASSATAPPPPPSGGTNHVEPPPVDGSRTFWDRGRITGVALFGVGALGLGTAALFGAGSKRAQSRAADLQGQLGGGGCAATPEPMSCSDLRSARSDQDSDAKTATVLVVGGAVFAAAGVAFFVWPRAKVNALPSASAQGASLQLTGSF